MLVRQGIGDLVDLAVVLLVKHDTIYADDGYDSPVCLLQATKLQKFGKMLMLEFGSLGLGACLKLKP